ncbi:MAG: phosphoribosylanthranilate isomerase [Chloroflexi bacterium]|nr:phosphoribosylanthranilate isomerase [Chloroflexota bacterium]
MNATLLPRVKICCISSVEEAWMAIHYGASALGLVSAMPSGPGVITEPLIAEIIAAVPPPIATFLLTSQQAADEIITQQRRCGANTLQLVDRVTLDTYTKLRLALPGINLVQVIHVVDETALAAAVHAAPFVDALLLDSGNPNLMVKELGGTGRIHNWEISRVIRNIADVPIFLAGGLTPRNVRQAIEQVAPFGIDVCSGVRTNGRLDETKLKQFFAQVGGIV